MTETIRKVTLRRLRMPLHVPYRLSYRTFEEFEPYLVEIATSEARHGFGDGHISPGSSDETREGGWAFSREMASAFPGKSLADAMARVRANAARSKVAATTFATAVEMVGQSELLDVDEPARLPLLSPISASEPDAIRRELDEVHAQGFRTVKIKIGRNLEADLARVAAIQEAAGGRFTLRIDANRAYDETEGCRFASEIDPDGIELFEQPCAAQAWDANAAVARASVVPLMLDEPICSNADIERAATIEGVGLCKLKLKRFGGLGALRESLDLVRSLGMEPVLGDGIGSEVTAWMEACVARSTIRNAGEFNGFLKSSISLFDEPLGFEDGAITMPAGYRPRLDPARVAAHTTACEVFEA